MEGNGHVELVLGVATLLGMGRLGGEAARALKAPPVVGEILAGVLLGPTCLGHLVPGLGEWLFPATGPARTSLEGLRLVSVCLLVLVAGLEVELGLLRRLGRSAAKTALGGLLIPFALGFGAAALAPAWLGCGPNVPTVAFAIFFGAAMAISALPVIARILMDLGLLRTDLGLLVLSSAMLDDVVGWSAFSIVLGIAGHGGGTGSVLSVLLGTAALAAFVLVLVRPVLDRALPSWQEGRAGPAGALAPVLALALAAGGAAEAIGTHAVLGAFLVGVAIRSESLREHVHETVSSFVTNVFGPIYFATIGLRVDFTATFEPGPVLVVLLIGCAGKLVGATIGTRLAGYPLRESFAVSAGLNARGAMEIVIAELAVQHGIASSAAFTALVVLALVTSILSGPLMKRVLARSTRGAPLADLLGDRVLAPLAARDASEAIEALAALVAPACGVDPTTVARAAIERQRLATTATGGAFAIPHARVAGATSTFVAIGVHASGIDFDAPDGAPVRIVALVVSPADRPSAHLAAFRTLASAFGDESFRARVLEDPGILTESPAQLSVSSLHA